MKLIDEYNVVVVGGGPAGIAAGIYAKYDGNNPIILEAKTLAWIPENHINLLGRVEGLPGLINRVGGTELKEMFIDSLSEMNVEYREHTAVESITRAKNGEFRIGTATGAVYRTKAAIICTGTEPKQLSCKGSDKFKNCIHYFAYNDFRKYLAGNKKVVVLGSRNSGATAAIYLAKNGLSVTIVEIKDAVQAKEKHTKQFGALGIKVITGAAIESLNGHKKLESATLRLQDNGVKEIPVDGIYCYIGVKASDKLLRMLGLKMGANGFFQTDFFQRSAIPGLFVAGDLCGDLKHIVASTGQGAKAAYNVNKFLRSNVTPTSTSRPVK